MAKKKPLKMAKQVIAFVLSLAVAGGLAKGMFTGVFLLSFLPLIVHQIVGYAAIVLVVLEVLGVVK